MSDAATRAEMPKGSQSVLDRRTVVNGNANLLHLLKRGNRVLDVGCGGGTITKDIAGLVGTQGSVVGIDTSEQLIAQARQHYAEIKNLSFYVADVNSYQPAELFDVVTSARVLQWLTHPADVVRKLIDLLKPQGCLTVLDYNHTKVEFSPELPITMQEFYAAFLKWRADAGMDNAIGDHLDEMFRLGGLTGVESADYSEVSIHGQKEFREDIAIWLKVAELRGPQVVADGYISESVRQQAREDYRQWIEHDAQYMRLYLRAVTGFKV